ncbi:hypothetical protein ACFPCV_38940 [Actinophytocola glycyrrhizae]|uniref:Uncharacterized protein n=1 Tax=Actinophytocola glycyrrhizae TaxID=2044873 RepID=A0ABV9SGG0_9PSEU
MGSTGGSLTHLFDPVADQVLCRGLRSGKVVAGPGVTDFAVLGCRRCAANAVRRGYEVFFNPDGAAMRFADFNPIS